MINKSLIMLENGYYEFGRAFSGRGTVFGEFVFNTSMSGYEEIITDPSYKGQVVVFTYPLIGNYGITLRDGQSPNINAEAIVVREYSNISSNFRSQSSLADYLAGSNVIGIQGIDTRELTKQIRAAGAMKGGISTVNLDPESFIGQIKQSESISDTNQYEQVINDKVVAFDGNPNSDKNIVAMDFGIKSNIIEMLRQRFGKVYLVPFDNNFDENIRKLQFDGLFLSNGPGDPRVVKNTEKYILDLPKNNKAVIGICFGHQLIGKSYGLEIVKLPFGHHGGNHPAKDMDSGKIYITAQNHNYAVAKDSVDSSSDWDMSWLNLYDNTVEGIRHRHLPVQSVQFHPEASPGPNEANEKIFNEFYNTVANIG